MIELNALKGPIIQWPSEATDPTTKALNVSSYFFDIAIQMKLILKNANVVHPSESGNMLIMAYAHAQRTGDISLISQHV